MLCLLGNRIDFSWSFIMLIFLWVNERTESLVYRSKSHSITYRLHTKMRGPNMEPCGTPQLDYHCRSNHFQHQEKTCSTV